MSVGRLAPCPCGSGKRYKDCHGRLAATPAVSVSAPAPEAVAEAKRLNDAALALQAGNDLPAAVAAFERAIALHPDFAEAHFNLGLALLLTGDYGRGWREYAWRTRARGYADYAHFDFGMPRWNGEPLAGKRLLVHAEQGQGDTVQFARFIPPLARQGARVDVFCHPPLATLVGRIPGVSAAMSDLVERPTHDYHAPILDLGASFLPERGSPHWFGRYLAPKPELAARWREELAVAPRPRVGLAWKGSPRHANDRNRSLTRDDASAIGLAGATILNLQVGEAPVSAGMVDAAPRLGDWEDTVALLSALDAVITVDTAVAHVAGAMEVPVAVLLPFAPDWRWGLAGESTPWYPSMRLLRQAARGDWSAPFERARAFLESLPR